METRKEAATKLDALAQQLKVVAPDGKERVLLEIVKTFPYLHGYWNQLLKLSNYDEQKIYEALEACPSLEMYKLAFKTRLINSDDALRQAMNTIGYHYRAGTLWAEIFQKRPESLHLLQKLVDYPLYDYAQLYQVAYETKSVSEDELSHKASKVSEEVNSLWQFESKLKRDYFHVLAIDQNELNAWVQYLKYTESLGNSSRTWQLYQRCLTVTALYPEFWIMWIRWIEISKISEIPSDSLQKVINSALHYHSHDPDIRLIASRHLEMQGKIDEAGKLLNENIPELLRFQKRHSVDISRYIGTDKLQFHQILTSHQLDPEKLFNLYEKGMCADPASYAQSLLDMGHSKEFFSVDSKLEY